jgi:hypothetical protein
MIMAKMSPNDAAAVIFAMINTRGRGRDGRGGTAH